MGEHPIQALMTTAMNSIKDMIDVNTIIGTPINSGNTTIIPVSKVSFGFAAGGSEFKGETIDEYNKKNQEEQIQYRLPFGGGSGAGVNISPIAFIVIQEETVKLLPVDHDSAIDKLLDYIPDLMEKASCALNKMMQKNDNCQNQKNKDKEIKNDYKESKVETSYDIEEFDDDDLD